MHNLQLYTHVACRRGTCRPTRWRVHAACRSSLARLVPVAQLTGDQRRSATRSWRHGALSELVYTPRRSTVTS